jgi:ABC-type transport system involved in Fe-S cluster assembly fused permease/ATPase subunit
LLSTKYLCKYSCQVGLNRTSIIISHRLYSITFVDEITAMKNGEIHETGTHEMLINKKGYYYQLWKQQDN